jgi:opacity protein-like surface antigen
MSDRRSRVGGLCAAVLVLDAAAAGESGTDLAADFGRALAQGPVASMAQEPGVTGPGFEAVQGPYIALYLSWGTIEGDFDNSVLGSFTDTTPDLIALPSMDPGGGFAIGIGARVTRELAVEMSYEWMELNTDATWSTGAQVGDATLQSFSLTVKYFFLTEGPIQPCVLVGLYVPWLDIDNGSLRESDLVAGDASLWGIGATLGGGLNFYLAPKVALTAETGWRAVFYTRAQGISGVEGRPDPYVDGSGFFFRAGVAIHF